MMKDNENITIAELTKAIGVSSRSIERNIDKKKPCMNFMQGFLHSDVCVNNRPFWFQAHAFGYTLND